MRTSIERMEHMQIRHEQMAEACSKWITRLAMRDQLQLFQMPAEGKLIPFPIAPSEEPRPPQWPGYVG